MSSIANTDLVETKNNNNVIKYIPPETLFKELQTDSPDTIEKKNKVLGELIENIYGKMLITKDQAKAFTRKISYLKTGLSAAVPLICLKERCPFYDNCSARVLDMDELEGKPCIVEFNLLNYFKQLYYIQFDVKEDDVGSQILVNELVELDIYDFRTTLSLSLGDSVTNSNIMAQNNNSEAPVVKNIAQALMTNVPHYNEVGTLTHVTQEMHVAYRIKERLKARKLKILELLVATRKEQYKKDAALKAKSKSDIADEQKRVLSRIEEMTKRIEAEETDRAFYESFIDSNVKV